MKFEDMTLFEIKKTQAFWNLNALNKHKLRKSELVDLLNKNKVKIKISKDTKFIIPASLQAKGYTNLLQRERRDILINTAKIKKLPHLSMWRKLNAMMIMRKNRTDKKGIKEYCVFKKDRDWIKKTFLSG